MEGKLTGSGDQKEAVLLVAVISAFLTAYMGSSINLALPSIGREFSADAILLSWVATSYLLSTAVFLIPVGRLADIYGRKRMFLTGLIIFTLASFTTSLTPNILSLLVCRVIQGVGSSMIFATGFAIVTSVYPANMRGRALGVTIAAVYIGLSAGPVAGGWFTQYFGWRSIFVFTTLVGFAAVVITLKKVRGEWSDAAGEPFDLKGSLIYGLSLIFLILGFSSLPSLAGFFLLFAGLAGLFVFVRFELNIAFPVLNLELFRDNTVFKWSNIAALINYSATFAIGFILSLHLQYIENLSPRDAGLVLVFQPFVMAVVSPLAGRMSDRIEPRVLATTGMGLNSLGLLFLIFVEYMTVPLIIGNLILLGAGFGLFASPNSNAIMGSVEKRHYGIASGFMNTMRLMGQMFSLGFIMLILSLFIGREPLSAANTAGFLQSVRIAFLLFFIFCFAGMFASYARGNVR